MTSDETVAGPIANSSMTLGSATASIVELSGTSTAPLATPSMAGLSSRARPGAVTGGARSRVLPSIST